MMPGGSKFKASLHTKGMEGHDAQWGSSVATPLPPTNVNTLRLSLEWSEEVWGDKEKQSS